MTICRPGPSVTYSSYVPGCSRWQIRGVAGRKCKQHWKCDKTRTQNYIDFLVPSVFFLSIFLDNLIFWFFQTMCTQLHFSVHVATPLQIYQDTDIAMMHFPTYLSNYFSKIMWLLQSSCVLALIIIKVCVTYLNHNSCILRYFKARNKTVLKFLFNQLKSNEIASYSHIRWVRCISYTTPSTPYPCIFRIFIFSTFN